MKKVISLFKRDYEGTRLVYDEVVEGAEWVTAGEGVATEKIDGTSCAVIGVRLHKRYDCKKGKQPPQNFIPAQDPDPITGHWPGWVPIGDGPEDKWHQEAWRSTLRTSPSVLYALGGEDANIPTDGLTYELVGPKVQGNKYNLSSHILRAHGDQVLSGLRFQPIGFAGVKAYLEQNPQYEGIVWWHPDGRMVKIKRKDFGLKW